MPQTDAGRGRLSDSELVRRWKMDLLLPQPRRALRDLEASVGGGQAIQVTHNGGWIAFESPDRESLYYEKYLSPGLWMLPLRGGEEKKVLESVLRRNFAVVDDGIYYMPDAAADGSTTLRFRSFRIAQDKEIARVKDVYQGLAVSPDRKTILFSAYSRSGTNVMVVDHFR